MVGMIVAGMSSAAMQETRQALALAEERQRLAVESAHIGTYHWNVITNTLVWSDKCKEIYGLPPDAPIDYARLMLLLHPDDRDRVDQAVRTALAGEAPN